MVAHTIFFIGLGLYDENDLPIKAKCVLKRCDKVFAEFYTSTMMGTNIETLEQSIGKKITLLNRDQTEKGDQTPKEAESLITHKYGIIGDPTFEFELVL